MDKLYALFAAHEGEGQRVTFLTSLTGQDVTKAETTYNMQTIARTTFMIGETNADGSRWLDADQRVWTIPALGSANVRCTKFPVFE